MMTPQELAFKAANLIEERGLAKELLQDSDGSLCVRGAMFQVLMGDPFKWPHRLGSTAEQIETWRTTERLIEAEVGYEDVADWNNEEDTTQDDVVQVLRKIASMPAPVAA